MNQENRMLLKLCKSYLFQSLILLKCTLLFMHDYSQIIFNAIRRTKCKPLEEYREFSINIYAFFLQKLEENLY